MKKFLSQQVITIIVTLTTLWSGAVFAQNIDQARNSLIEATNEFIEAEGPWRSWTTTSENTVRIPKELSSLDVSSQGLFAWVGLSNCNLCFTGYETYFRLIEEVN